jgi:hypothetical protein
MNRASSSSTDAHIHIKVADEVWIAAVLLQQEHPHQDDFSIEDIVEYARRRNLSGVFRPGLYVHVVQHCVANRPPNPARYRMLIETSPGRRRLFRTGDAYDPRREGGKTTPASQDLPLAYVDLLKWYSDWAQRMASAAVDNDPLLSLQGSGRHLWSDEHADDYVRRLREGWE